MTPLEYVNAAPTERDDLGYRRLSFEEVEWLLERGFEVERTIPFNCDIVSYPARYILDVLHPGCSWGTPHFTKAEIFMERLWKENA